MLPYLTRCIVLLIFGWATNSYSQYITRLDFSDEIWYDSKYFNLYAPVFQKEGITKIEKFVRHLPSSETSLIERITLDSIGRVVFVEDFSTKEEVEKSTTYQYKGMKMQPASKIEHQKTPLNREVKTKYGYSHEGKLHRLSKATWVDGKSIEHQHMKISYLDNGLPAELIQRTRERSSHVRKSTRTEFIWKAQTRQLEVWRSDELLSTWGINAEMAVESIISAAEGRTNFMYEDKHLIQKVYDFGFSASKVREEFAYDERGLLVLNSVGLACPDGLCKQFSFMYQKK